jgi:hypothetical protein
MNVLGPKKIVLLGMMTKIPVAGAVWGTMQYLIGLGRLGYDAYYVEAHARTPSMLIENDDDDSSALAAAYIGGVMSRFDMKDKWAFHALHDDGRCYGMSEGRLRQLYRDAALIINYHGSHMPLPEHYETGRLVYLETDPVELEVQLYHKAPRALQMLAPHAAFFTWGLNYGNPSCKVPLPEGVDFRPLPPAVVPELWESPSGETGVAFTTVGNWRQPWREVTFRGEVYRWSKHYEFLKFLDLPSRTEQPLELALGSYEEPDKCLLESKGWKVRPASEVSANLDHYRAYVAGSRGEFTVAKDQNIRLCSGWFSERSATYLASGRPVVTQETGFSNVLPTGNGLFGFSTMEEILAALEGINRDYPRHCRAARALAREYFSYDVVLRRMVAEMGV